MNDDSRTEFLRALRIAKEWVAWIDEASGKGAPIEFVTDLDVGSSYAEFRMEMTDDKRKVTAILSGDFLDDHALESRSITMTMTEQDIPHSDGAMP